MKILESNYKVLEAKKPNTLKRIEELETKNHAMIEKLPSGDVLAVMDGNGRKWYLNSKVDSNHAAAVYAKRYTVKKFATYFIFGISDGKHVREFLKQCDETNHIVLYEPNEAVFALACGNFDLSDILADSRVVLCVENITDGAETLIKTYLDYTDLIIMDFCILPGYDILYGGQCEAFMDIILDRIEDEVIKKGTRLTFNRMVPRHTLYNMKKMISCENIYQLQTAIRARNLSGIPAIIVSAGPSLDKNIQELKKAEGKSIIIVVDAAVRTVIKNGITPDIVCTIDPESPDRFFEGVDLQNCVWCCNRMTRPWIMEQYGRRVYYYGSFEPWWNEVLNKNTEYEFPDMATGGCVSAIAFSLACYLGFRTIVLVGQDMAFTGGISHTKGIEGAFGDNDEYIKSRYLIEVEGIDGDMLETDYQMWYYKKWFEKAIAANRNELCVLDATEGGARIEGAEIRKLSQVIGELCKDEFIFSETEQRIEPAYSTDTQQVLLCELGKMKTYGKDIQEMIRKNLTLQMKILESLKKNGEDLPAVKSLLAQMMKNNEVLENMSLFEIMTSYAQKEEYELGDSIYEKEEVSLEELVEKNRMLYEGYDRAVEMLLEDIEEYIIEG